MRLAVSTIGVAETLNPVVCLVLFVLLITPSPGHGHECVAENKVINMTNRNLEFVNLSIFENCARDAKTLNLSGNAITSLTNISFRDTTRLGCTFYALEHLDLSNNEIERLEPNSFHCLSDLKTLVLRKNKLTSLPAGILSDKFNLEVFDASFNEVSTIEIGVFSNSYLKNLKYINLRYNKIRYFEPWPYILPSSNTFDLSHNEIENFTNSNNYTYDLKEPFVTTTILRYNKIQHWRDEFLQQYNPGKDIAIDLVTYNLDMMENNFTCDCHLHHVVNSLQQSFFLHGYNTELLRIKCAAPWNLQGKELFYEVNTRELLCNVTTDCPDKCLCQRQPEYNKMTINCTGVQMKELPYTLPSLKRNEKLDMILDRTIIESLEYRNYSSSIARLTISQSQLRNIDSAALEKMDFLELLDISRNSLKSIPNSITRLKYENTIIIGNPFECDCNMTWMAPWIELASPDTDGRDIQCSHNEDNYKILDVDDSLLGCNYDVAIALAVTFGVLLIIVIGVTVWAKRCPYETKVLLFKFFRIHPGDKYKVDKELDTEFDVYVVCDDKEIHVRQWVLRKFAKKLENKKPKYTIFIPCRDLPPGEDEASYRISTMKKSRRIVIILSDNFFANDLCLMECQNVDLLQRNEGRIIFIRYNATVDERLEEEPWVSRMKGRHMFSLEGTKREEQWFWAKLRYELPVPTTKTRNRIVNDSIFVV